MKLNIKSCIFIFCLIITGSALSVLLNYSIDPYNIFNHKSISGINDKKPARYTDRTGVIYSDMELNGSKKSQAFLGSTFVYRDDKVPYNIAFYTNSQADDGEIKNIIDNIIIYAPDIKKIYFGIDFNGIFNESAGIEDETDEKYSVRDIFFSMKTLKRSFQTLKESVKTKMEKMEYVYPYRQIVFRPFLTELSEDAVQKMKEVKEYAASKGLDLIYYYTPVNITYKMHIKDMNLWDRYEKYKKELASASEYYDYSLNNEYNTEVLDGSGKYYNDSVHTSSILNEIIVKDLISGSPETGVLVNQDNADEIIKNDSDFVDKYIEENQDIMNKIQNMQPSSALIKIRRNNEPYSRKLL